MITSPKTSPTSFLSEIELGAPIPEEKLAYFEQRAMNNFYAFVLRKFIASGVKKSELSSRVSISPSQLTRYLASPSNWTIATVQRLLIGICGEEVFLSSEPLIGRPPQNHTMVDLLDPNEMVAATSATTNTATFTWELMPSG